MTPQTTGGQRASWAGAPPRSADEMRRFAIFFVFAASLALAGYGDLFQILSGLVGGLIGYGLATGFHLLWGPRTRPKNNIWWWLGGAVWFGLIWYASFDASLILLRGLSIGILFAFGLGLASRHDLGLSPSLMLAAAVLTSLYRGDRIDGQAGGVAGLTPALAETDATWIALTVLLGLVAATFEHDRLARRDGPGTPFSWSVIRIAFVSLWTLIVLALREEVQWGRVFVALGANLEGQGGQMLLIGILLVALVVAALMFKPTKEGPPQGGPKR